MLPWREIPFVRLLLPFLLGLLLALNFNLSFSFLPVILVSLLVLLSLFTFSSIAFKQRWLFGSFLYLFFISFGYYLGFMQTELHQQKHFQQYLEKENHLLVQVDEFPTPGKRIRLTSKVLGIAQNAEPTKWQEASGHLLLYLEPNLDNAALHYGDQIILRSKVNPIPGPQNPEAFDYQKYQHFKNTHYQSFVKADQWKIVDQNQGHPLLSKAFAIRKYFLGVLKKHLPSEAEFGVAAALILGNRSAITAEVRNAYASTGATHVLAVSGLHVGLIYLGISFLLNLFRGRGKTWRIFKTLIMIGVVWGFAFITGASASVLRAATMFSFIILGRTLNQHTNIYNTLALSAFFLLCYDPYLIADVGFQLSYLAVLGIVSFQAYIYRLWIIDHWLGDYIWKLISVSLAAQLTTFPICLYYFHQFPFYFWLSGLIVVPTALLILAGGILLFLMEMVLPFFAGFIGQLLYGIIWIMNALIYMIQQLPAALIQGLWIGFEGMMLLYLVLLFLTIVFWQGKRYRALASLAAVALVLGAIAWQSFSRYGQKEIVVYQVTKNSLVDIVDGRSVFSFQSAGLDEKSANYAAQNLRWKLGMREQKQMGFDQDKIQNKHWYYQKGFLQFYDQRLAFLNQNQLQNSQHKMELDYLLLRDNPTFDILQVQQKFPGAIWLADASNTPWTVAAWQQECESLQIPFVNLAEEGAQIIHIHTK